MACVDHKYERGAYGVCKRCGGDGPRVEAKKAKDAAYTARLKLAIEGRSNDPR